MVTWCEWEWKVRLICLSVPEMDWWRVQLVPIPLLLTAPASCSPAQKLFVSVIYEPWQIKVHLLHLQTLPSAWSCELRVSATVRSVESVLVKSLLTSSHAQTIRRIKKRFMFQLQKVQCSFCDLAEPTVLSPDGVLCVPQTINIYMGHFNDGPCSDSWFYLVPNISWFWLCDEFVLSQHSGVAAVHLHSLRWAAQMSSSVSHDDFMFSQ